MENKNKKYENIVLLAIMKAKDIKNFEAAMRFASMNNTVYEVALEAVKLAD